MSQAKPLTFDYLRSKKKPVTTTVPICMDSEVADRYARLQIRVELKRTQLAMDPNDRELRREVEDLQAQFEQAEAEVEKLTVRFKFKSLGRQAYDDLIKMHPPTKAQIAEAKEKGYATQQWNIETFPMALITVCCIEPDLTDENVKEMFTSDDWNEAELTMLWEAALNVNSQRRIVDLGKD